VERRSSGIGNANDFVTSDEGIDRLDAICMMLIAIGESCKHLDKMTDGRFAKQNAGLCAVRAPRYRTLVASPLAA
jgi:hypothetical protein